MAETLENRRCHSELPPIILASASPRRKAILQNLGLSFTIHPSQVDESFDPTLPPARVVQHLAQQKALGLMDSYQRGLIISADTVVVLDEEILGKPQDGAEARRMLRRLSGKRHTVYSGLAVADAESGQLRVGYRETDVWLRSMTAEEIETYVASGEPLDKAGSYAIQGLGATLVEKINGDYFTVMGLPINLLAQFLHHFGLDLLRIARPN